MLLCVVMEAVANSYEGLMAGTRIGKERKRKRARRAEIPHRSIEARHGQTHKDFLPTSSNQDEDRKTVILSIRYQPRSFGLKPEVLVACPSTSLSSHKLGVHRSRYRK